MKGKIRTTKLELLTSYLSITSFESYTRDTPHHYARIRVGGTRDEIDVMRAMTALDAVMLNKKDRCKSYKEGSLTTRYGSKAEAYRAAIETFKEKVGAGILIFGGFVIASPQEIVFAYPPFDSVMARANVLWREYEKLNDDGGYDNHRDRMNDLCEEWYVLLDKQARER